jgi:transcriptional regulator with XRE-family HTH domain
MNSNQCKMARAAVGMGVRDLAKASGVAVNTVTRFERGEPILPRTLTVLRGALEAAGVQFLNTGDVATGPGVALRN